MKGMAVAQAACPGRPLCHILPFDLEAELNFLGLRFLHGGAAPTPL